MICQLSRKIFESGTTILRPVIPRPRTCRASSKRPGLTRHRAPHTGGGNPGASLEGQHIDNLKNRQLRYLLSSICESVGNDPSVVVHRKDSEMAAQRC